MPLTSRAFVVSFRAWASDATVRADVEAALDGVAPREAWRLADRDPVMAALPTDFVLLEVLAADDSVAQTACSALRQHPRVRSVTPQRHYARPVSNGSHSSSLTAPAESRSLGRSWSTKTVCRSRIPNAT